MFDSIYTLGHGFWIKPNETNFDLGLDEKIIKPSCSNFSYVSEKIIVVKTKRLITIFSFFRNSTNNRWEEKGKSFSKFLGQ